MKQITYTDLLSRPKLRTIMKNNKESRLQQQCVYWFRVQYPQYARLLTHPINEGSDHTSQDRRRQAIHKAEGTIAGVPDLLLFVPADYIVPVDEHTTVKAHSYHGLGIEMKTKTGRQSQEQKDFQKMYEAAGYKYVVVRSLDDFKNVVNEYLSFVADAVALDIRETHRALIEAQDKRELAYFKKVIGKKEE